MSYMYHLSQVCKNSTCLQVYACSLHMQFACAEQVCHIGDALGEDAAVPGGFAGLVVDLFADGQILPALSEVQPVAICCVDTAHTCMHHQ